MLLFGLALTLLFSAVSIFVFRTPHLGTSEPAPLTRFFLVALRLAIGWHFFVEGMDKLNAPAWSSEPYLREATGPLAPRFRDLAGDRLLDKLTVGENGAFPEELAVEWQATFDAYKQFYEWTPEQTQQAEVVFDQAKANTKTWLTSGEKVVQKISEYPPPLMVSMTVPERLKVVQALEAQVHEIEEVLLPRYGTDAFAKLKTAKANLAKWRGELKADLDKQTVEFKQALRDKVLVPIAVAASSGIPAPQEQSQRSSQGSASVSADNLSPGAA